MSFPGMAQRILVTGGAGFIGSNLVDALVSRGHRVLVLDDLSTGVRSNVPETAEVAQHDIRSPAVADVFDRFRPEVVFHLAAQMDVRRSVADPAFDADVNIIGTLRLLELCRKVGTRRILFSSTGGAIYGEQDTYPAPETHPTRPLSPYGVAKLSVEHYLYFYGVEYGFRSTCLRFANVYGPRQNPHGEAGVVAIFVKRLLAGEMPTIHGTGEQTRDFVFVGDVVRANLLSLEHDLLGAFNVGTGIETSVNTLYEAIRRAVGTDIQAMHGPAKPGEQARSSLDSRALSKATGWRPETSLDEGIVKTVDYFRARL